MRMNIHTYGKIVATISKLKILIDHLLFFYIIEHNIHEGVKVLWTPSESK